MGGAYGAGVTSVYVRGRFWRLGAAPGCCYCAWLESACDMSARDVSPAVLNKLRKQMEEMGGDWSNVTLLERAADNLEGFAEKSFDTVILNSVVKYFPSASYLIGVLEGALRLVKPGGRIFIGDVETWR